MRSRSRLFAGLLWLLLAHVASAAVQEPKVLERKPVEYPPSARRLGHEGTVTVSVEVLADGAIGATSVITSSGSPLLDDAGLRAVREWRFEPATGEDGKPIDAKGSVQVEFKLTQNDEPYVPSTEAERLGEIWLAYRNYQSFGQEFANKCQGLGKDTKAAVAANRKFNTEADAQFAKLEQRLRTALAAKGADPDRQLNDFGLEVDAAAKLRVAELLAKGGDPGSPPVNCETFIDFWGRLEGSFRFSEFYERLMAL
jgi:TonB family protein